MKPINRRSFFTKAVGLFGLLFVSPDRGAPVNEEAIVTIHADGLQPQLEAHMWKIFKEMQIRAEEMATVSGLDLRQL